MRNKLLYIVVASLMIAPTLMAESISLNQFLEKVEAHSKDLKLAAEDLEYAKATKRDALAGALPSISGTAGYNRNLSSNYLFVDFGDEPSRLKLTKDNEYRAGVRLDQTLFSGAVYNAIRAANEYSKLTEYMYQASENEIITIAKKSFYQALLLKEVFKVAGQSEANALDNFTNIKNGYEAGLKSEFEKLQAEVRYLESIPTTTLAERNLNLALMNLKSMAGVDLDGELLPAGSLTDYPSVPPEVGFSEILNRRPDYNAYIWEQRLRATGVRAEKAGRMPTLKGYLAYNYSAQSDEFKFEDENNSYTVGLNLSLPIFTGGRTSAKIKQAEIELNRSQINIDRSTDNIKTETMSIRLRLNEAYSRIESAQAAFTTAQKAFKIAEATSKAGLSTQLELKDTQIVLDQTQVGYYSAIYEYLDAYFDWEKTTGQLCLVRLPQL